MAASSFYCSIQQGFNFQKDEQLTVGHLYSLEIGTVPLPADIDVMDPIKLESDKDSRLKVVGVFSSMFWNGGYAEPMQFSCQVSTANKQKAVEMQHTKLSNTEVKLAYAIFEYDPVDKKFFKAMHTGGDDSYTKLEGLIEKSGERLSLMINTMSSPEVPSPLNYTLSMGVMPQEKEQDVHFAASVKAKFVKKWGVTVKSG